MNRRNFLKAFASAVVSSAVVGVSAAFMDPDAAEIKITDGRGSGVKLVRPGIYVISYECATFPVEGVGKYTLDPIEFEGATIYDGEVTTVATLDELGDFLQNEIYGTKEVRTPVEVLS